ncbi:MAG: protease inhibitor I42 family protein [Tatlockia sp.]|nr:protease inhibitor I42 family protein [Tatlockia sp.]
MTVNANQNQFQVTLPANPTTGYQWEVISFDSSFLQLLYSQYLPPKSQLAGAGGEMQFTFELIAGKNYPAKTTLEFKYHRPWEAEGSTLKTIKVNFQKAKL